MKRFMIEGRGGYLYSAKIRLNDRFKAIDNPYFTHLRHLGLYSPLARISYKYFEQASRPLGSQSLKNKSKKIEYQNSLSEIRVLLREGAKELKLEELVFEKGLLLEIGQRRKEVPLRTAKKGKLYRLDLLVENPTSLQLTLYEFKSGKIKFISQRRNSKPNNLLIKGAIPQINNYKRILLDKSTIDVSKRKTITINWSKTQDSNIKMKIVGGRRLSSPEKYSLIQNLESTENDLEITNWDDFLDELERCLT